MENEMEKEMETGCIGITYLWLAGNEGVEKTFEATIIGYIGTTTRIHSFSPS